MSTEGMFRHPVSRRSLLKVGAAGALASQLAMFEQLAWMPQRLAFAAPAPPDIQHDISAFEAPATVIDNGGGQVQVQLGPVFTLFVPAKLTRAPTKDDQTVLANALITIESVYPFSPSGVFALVSYGLPYFNRLPAGLVNSRMPRLLSNPGRFALEEAVPSPTDVVAGGGITKKTFNVPVQIEANDVLFTLRSDSLGNLGEIVAWAEGSNRLAGQSVPSPIFNGLFVFQTPRLMSLQIGLPRKIADTARLPYASRINPQSPLWMSFGNQQVASTGPAAVTTFVGNASARFTTAVPGDYFDNGSLQHLSHSILDLAQFYLLPAQDPLGRGEPYTERVQYMFRSNQLGTTNGIPSAGNTDQFKNAGGPAFLNTVFQGTDAALRAAQDAAGTFTPPNQTLDATFSGTGRIGHVEALQRSSRAADGTPVHIRIQGPGFDTMDVPDGRLQPKHEFAIFTPSAEFFRTMRVNAAAQDLQQQFNIDQRLNGLERFMTTTRRQNFLSPPRRHRAFPLLELT
jgi:hypothetical protein